MVYMIAEPCIGVKDRACVDVCPVDCIYEGDAQLFIHPDECIGCGLCEPVCPVRAIFAEVTLPQAWGAYVANRRQFFIEHPRVQPAQGRGKT
jgi:ferredoxin